MYEERKASRKKPMIVVLLLSVIPVVIFLMADIFNFIQKYIGKSTDDEDLSGRDSARWKERIPVSHDGSACEFSKNDIETKSLKRDDFCRNLRERASICKNKIPLPESLSNSKAYSELTDCIRECSEVEEDDRLWDSLLDAIKESSPRFLENLNLLVGCVPSISDLHTCILIRCNIGTKQMANILGISQSGVVSRRRKICQLAYSEDIELSCMDNVVRLL